MGWAGFFSGGNSFSEMNLPALISSTDCRT